MEERDLPIHSQITRARARAERGPDPVVPHPEVLLPLLQPLLPEMVVFLARAVPLLPEEAVEVPDQVVVALVVLMHLPRPKVVLGVLAA